jgi:type IV secretion system protein VirB5
MYQSKSKLFRIVLPVLLVLGAFSPRCHAQIPVTDVGAIAQLLIQVQQLTQQLQTIQNQLTQAQMEYQSITGPRGMQNLLSGTNRNYLPLTWSQMQSIANGSGGVCGTLSGSIQVLTATNAILSPAAMTSMSPAERNAIQAQRQSAALQQAVSQQALSTTSNRFASLQQLIGAIPSATDQKGILELQARIGAEQGMLQNEQTKLQVLFKAAQAQDAAQRQQMREQAIVDSGNLRGLPAMGLH